MVSITDFFKLIPDSLKQSAVDALVETVVERGEGLLSDSILNKIKGLRSDAAFRKQLDAGLQRGLQRFVDEYQLEDEDLVTAVLQSPALFTNPEIQAALVAIVQQPGRYLVEEQALIGQSFAAVLPERINRDRVDRAVFHLLKCLAQELWHLPELQPIYSLEFQRITAESTREQLDVQKAQLAALETLNSGVREALLQLTDVLTEQKQLPPGSTTATLPTPRPAVYHNLPQPDYGEFVGREKELRQIFDLLRPYPQSRHHLIVIDGIGGIGKSALALEVANRCLYASQEAARGERAEQDHLTWLRQVLLDRFNEEELRTLCFDMALDYEMLPGRDKGGKTRELLDYLHRRNRIAELITLLRSARPDIRETDLFATSISEPIRAEQFQAIIWTSAKRTVLTADGIVARRQVLRTIDDVYTAIAVALQRDDITRVSGDHQDELVRRALTQQRTLLIIDNFETVDDANVITFLRELPDPTKAIVTTRHRIDAAYPIRLGDMPWLDAQKLIANQSEEKQVKLTNDQARRLYAHTGGVPLAISWSIAQIGFGYPIRTVLRRLGQPHEDIARFCFEEALSLIHRYPAARQLLLGLSLFEAGATRQTLGQVAGLADDLLSRDEGLVQLEKLSLVNKENGRFSLLPLTRDYVTAERLKHPEEDRELVENWLTFHIDLVQKDGSNHARWYNFDVLTEEGQNILAAVDWAFSAGRIHEALILMTAVFWYLDIMGRWADSLKYGDKAIELASRENENLALAGICRQAGWIKAQLGQFEAAQNYFQRGLAAAEKVPGLAGITIHTDLLITLGQATRKAGDFQQSRQIFERCQQAIDTHHLSNEIQADLDFEWGKWARDQQDWDTAQHYFQRVLDWADQMRQQQRGYQYDMALGTQGNMAFIRFQQGHYAEARAMCQRAMQFYETQGGKPYFAILNYRFALIEEALGDNQSAQRHATIALQLAQQMDLVVELPIMHALVARLQAGIPPETE
jgi:tetratricopeptide (TPR) repeat protein